MSGGRFKWICNYLLTGLLVVIIAVGFVGSQGVSADVVDWLSPSMSAEKISDRSTNVNGLYKNRVQQCLWQDVQVGNSKKTDRACVYQAKTFRFAHIYRCTPNWWGSCDSEHFMAVGFNNDYTMHKVQNMPIASDYDWIASKQSDTLVVVGGGIVKDLPRYLVSTTGSTGNEFTFDSQVIHYLKDENNQGIYNGAIAISEDGQWAVFEVQNQGLMRVNLSDYSVQLFTKSVARYGYGLDPSYEFSITHDGQYIVVSGMNAGANLYRLTDGCGEASGTFKSVWRQSGGTFKECPKKQISDVLVSANGGAQAGFRYLTFPSFSSDGGYLEGLYAPNNNVNGAMVSWMRVTAAGYAAPTSLDYLAMGDSFSSGEGDSDAYYQTKDDKRCHVSSRSYPFLLRDYLSVSIDRMQSVACSGAKVVPDYMGNSSNYIGQRGGLKDLSSDDQDHKREDALASFSPGYVTQLEFVKKYQPKVLTLTGGGNDVGFVDMLTYCAYGSGDLKSPWQYVDEGFFGLFTCPYALKGSSLQQAVLRQIDDQYKRTVQLLDKIEATSPQTTVYLIGYPSFIKPDQLALCLNSLELDYDERAVIDYYLKRLNQQLKRAADESDNAKYIDIYDVLKGGRLCEGSGYMTGPLTGDRSGWFHPNATGHAMIADRIYSRIESRANPSEMTQNTVVTPDNIGQPYDGEVQSSLIVKNGEISTGSQVHFSVPDYSFASSSSVVVTLHSDTTDLGSLQVNTSGGIEADTTIPDDIGTGYHILTLEGIAPSGSKLMIMQFLKANLGDIGTTPSDGYKENLSFPRKGLLRPTIEMTQISVGHGDTLKITDKQHDQLYMDSRMSQFHTRSVNDVIIPGAIVALLLSSLLYWQRRKYGKNNI